MGMSPRLLRPRATGFNPKSIANLAGWWDATVSSSLFDANSGGSLPALNGAVMRWEDISGNGRHLTQPTNTVNNAPIRKIADSNTAGKDSVRFDSSNDFLSLSSNVATSGGASMFIVHKKESDNAGGLHNFSAQASQSNHNPFSGGAGYFDSFATNPRRSWSQAFSSTRRLYSIVSGTSWIAYINGVAVNTVTGHTPANSNADRPQGFGAGAYLASTQAISQPSDAFFCEVLLYDRALTASEHTAVSNYLIKKWSL